MDKDLDQYENYRVSQIQIKDQEKILAQKKTEEKRLKEEQVYKESQAKREAEQSQRKQVLIQKYGQTMGIKVFNQEPAVGMTKAMFNDMKLWIVSTQKTQTANGTVEAYICQFGLYNCKRIIIINQKITQIDTFNCN